MKLFKELGEALDADWREQDRRLELLPSLAAEALVKSRLTERVTVDEICDWVLAGVDVKQDLESRFGEPPITVYASPYLFIEALYWVGMRTTLHEHGFAGAFTVLQGASVQAIWDFKSTKSVSNQIDFGELSLRTMGRVRQGDVTEILPGEAFIHSVLHLAKPTVSIVVRSYGANGARAQRDFVPPNLSYSPTAIVSDQRWRRQAQLMYSLHRADPEGSASRLDRLWGQATASGKVALAVQITEFGLYELVKELLDGKRSSDPMADALWPAVVNLERRERIWDLATAAEAVPHRLLFALLMELENRAQVLDWLKTDKDTGDPIESLVTWVRELRAADGLGFELDELNYQIFERLVRGNSDAEIAAELARKPEHAAIIRRNCEVLRGSSIWQRLLR